MDENKDSNEGLKVLLSRFFSGLLYVDSSLLITFHQKV